MVFMPNVSEIQTFFSILARGFAAIVKIVRINWKMQCTKGLSFS